MSWIAKIALGVVLRAILKQGDRITDAELTDAEGKDIRREIENWLHRLATNKHKGWLGWLLGKTTMDDRGLRFAQVVFKSRWLDKKLSKARP